MKNKLLDLLACPYDGHFPLEMRIFEADDEIVEGILICSKCSRWYPIRDKIPEMLPDELRNEKEEKCFLDKWKDVLPQPVIKDCYLNRKKIKATQHAYNCQLFTILKENPYFEATDSTLRGASNVEKQQFS